MNKKSRIIAKNFRKFFKILGGNKMDADEITARKMFDSSKDNLAKTLTQK